MIICALWQCDVEYDLKRSKNVTSSLNVSNVRSAIPCEPYMLGSLIQRSDSFYFHPIPADKKQAYSHTKLGRISQNTQNFFAQ